MALQKKSLIYSKYSHPVTLTGWLFLPKIIRTDNCLPFLFKGIDTPIGVWNNIKSDDTGKIRCSG